MIIGICLVHLNDLIQGTYPEISKEHFIISSQCEICELEK